MKKSYSTTKSSNFFLEIIGFLVTCNVILHLEYQIINDLIKSCCIFNNIY